MAAKPKSVFVCSDCGGRSPKWAGQCPECSAWNTISETIQQPSAKNTRFAGFGEKQVVTKLRDVEIADVTRITTGIGELDRVLGGGLVPGSVVLIGGDPGIGKSTLLLQNLAVISANTSALYVTGEESMQQIAWRAQRLELNAADLNLLADNQLESILATIHKNTPSVIVGDSIQTFYTDELTSAPGSVAQVRECGARLVRLAKQTGCAVILVGHVTKEGHLAGPRILEHMVDAVLYFEGDKSSRYRLIRAIKNRFGAVNEIGVFGMTEKGLREVTNPSAMFINRHDESAPGSVVAATQEGTRPLLVEVQALVDPSTAPNPRRLCVGLEQNRLAMLLAVLHRHAGYSLANQDVFVNVVGGVRINEPAADIPVTLAAVSSFLDKPVPRDLIAFGEVGLTGEVRPVQRGIDRLREAAKLGFKRALIPVANKPKQSPSGIKIIPLERVSDCLKVLE